MMGLSNYVRYLIDSFINRTELSNALYEPDDCEVSVLSDLNAHNLLNDPTVVMVPNAWQAATVFSQMQNINNSDFVFVRGSTNVTRVDDVGNIQPIPWNQLSNSQNFGAWQLVNATLDANFYTAPDGSNTARLLLDTTSSTDHRIQLGGDVSDNIFFTFSAYLKMQNIRYANLSLTSGITQAYFDLQTGTELGTTGVDTTSDIEPVGNGWYRCSVTGRKTSGTALPRIILSKTGTNITFIGTGNDGIYIWGAQTNQSGNPKNVTYCKTLARTDFPKIDYTNGGCGEIQIEPQKSNFLLYSSDLTNAVWAKTNVVVDNTSEVGPSLSTFTSQLTATSNDASIIQYGSQASNLSGSRLFSIYLKRKTGSGNIIVSIGRTSITTSLTNEWERYYVYDTPLSGTYTSTSGNITVVTSEPHGLLVGDLIRFDATSGAALDAYATILTTPSTTQLTFTTGTSTSSGACFIQAHFGKIEIKNSGDAIYAWGGQLEIGLNNTLFYQPTSFIPSSGSIITRSGENMYIRDIQANNIITDDFTVFVNIKRIGGSNSSSVGYLTLSNFLSNSPSSNTDMIIFTGLSNNRTGIYTKQSSGSVTQIVSALPYEPIQEDFYKCVMTMNASVLRVYFDGVQVATTSFARPDLIDNIGFWNGSNCVYLKEIAIWKRCLSLNEIDDLNAYPYFNFPDEAFDNIETQKIINRAAYEGFTLPPQLIARYIDDLITEMKNDELWQKTDAFFNFAYNDVNLLNFSRINWFSPYSKLGLAEYVDISYLTSGIQGNGTSGYAATGYTPLNMSNQYTLNDAGRMMVVYQAYSGSSWALDGNESGSNNNIMANLNVNNTFRINSTNSLSSTFDATGTGLKGIFRTSSTSVKLVNGSVINNSLTQSSTGLSGFQQTLLKYGSNYGNSILSNYWIGGSLTDSQIINFRAYYNQFLNNIGLSPIA